jgi:hypothetical protein
LEVPSIHRFLIEPEESLKRALREPYESLTRALIESIQAGESLEVRSIKALLRHIRLYKGSIKALFSLF